MMKITARLHSIVIRTMSVFMMIITLFSFIPENAALAASSKTGLGKQAIKGGKADFMWPVPNDYRLSRCFYDQRDHYALDIFTSSSKTVVASYAGKVVEIVKNGKDDGGYGNAVMIEHDYKTAYGTTIKLYTRYAHLASVSVKKNDVVKRGTNIGKTGGSGYGKSNAYPIHLDFQVLTSKNWRNRKSCSIDPYANFLLELPANIKKGGTTACCDSYIAAVKKIYVKPDEVKLSTPELTTAGLKLKWNEAKRAFSYEIWRAEASNEKSLGTPKKLATISNPSTTTYTDNTIKNGKYYSYMIKAVNSFGSTNSTKVKAAYLTAPSFKKTTVGNYRSGSYRINVEWVKNSAASGYEIQYSTSSNFSNSKTISINSAKTVKDQIVVYQKGTYYLRIRAVKGNVKSAWSGTVSVKVK